MIEPSNITLSKIELLKSAPVKLVLSLNLIIRVTLNLHQINLTPQNLNFKIIIIQI